MTWINDNGITRWSGGDFPEPSDDELAAYRDRYEPAPCGTYGGYKRHRREQTPICDKCRWARRNYEARERRSA